MECGRTMIYFSTYENGVKIKPAGYAAVFIRGEQCDVQLYYRGAVCEEACTLQPVYVFRDGSVVLGQEFAVEEGMAAATIRTGRLDFMQSGRCLEELETIYLDGVKNGICGGRMDGRELEDAAYTLTDWTEQEEITEELKEEQVPEEYITEETFTQPEPWSFAECLERFPEQKLPFDGIRRKCCRMSLEDLNHLPEELQVLKENHFLLHGYYEYHHLLLAELSCRCGIRYVLGVPGEFCYRNQYMAENFGFYDFAPLEPGKRRNGSFGYWYFYLKK